MINSRERHAEKLERQDRKEREKEIRSHQRELNERYGEATMKVNDPDGNAQEVSGADCPECEEGVIVVIEKPESYPPFEEKCLNCDW